MPVTPRSKREEPSFGRKHELGRAFVPATNEAQLFFRLSMTAGFQTCSFPADGRSESQSAGNGARDEKNQSSKSTWFRQ